MHGQIWSGWPLIANEEVHIRKVLELIKDNQQIIQMEIAVKLGISQDHMGHIIAILHYLNIFARWIACMLKTEMKASRVKIFLEFLSCFKNEGDEFLYFIVTADKAALWPEIKCPSMEYHHKSSKCRVQ